MPKTAEQAEELADALRRTFVIEGISAEKANEMAVEKTVEMCRASTRSDLVKSVLPSTTFEDAKTVIAKYIIETSAEIKERKVLAFNSNRHQGNFRGQSGRGGYSANNWNNRSSYSGGNFDNRNGSSGGNWNGRGNWYNNGNRGRNDRGGRGGGQGNGGNARNVRAVQSENSAAPQQMSLGQGNNGQ